MPTRPPVSGTRHGSGSWGGPAKGAGTGGAARKPRKPRDDGEPKYPPLSAAGPGQGNTTLTGDERRAREAERAALLKDHLFALATGAEREETQVRAAEAWLNRAEGMPIARSVNLNLDDVANKSDAEIAAEIARLGGAVTAATQGTAPENDPE